MTNVCDRCYIGPNLSVSLFTPLLKPLSTNFYAILFLLFQNVIPEIDSGTPEPLLTAMKLHTAEDVMQYLPYPDMRNPYESCWSPDVHRYQGGAEMLRDFEVQFAVYAD